MDGMAYLQGPRDVSLDLPFPSLLPGVSNRHPWKWGWEWQAKSSVALRHKRCAYVAAVHKSPLYQLSWWSLLTYIRIPLINKMKLKLDHGYFPTRLHPCLPTLSQTPRVSRGRRWSVYCCLTDNESYLPRKPADQSPGPATVSSAKGPHVYIVIYGGKRAIFYRPLLFTVLCFI